MSDDRVFSALEGKRVLPEYTARGGSSFKVVTTFGVVYTVRFDNRKVMWGCTCEYYSVWSKGKGRCWHSLAAEAWILKRTVKEEELGGVA